MYRKFVVLGVFTSLGLGAIACDRPGADATYQVTDSAGVKLVMNAEQGVWAPDEVWQFREDLRIESPEDEPGREFGMLAGVVVDSRGVISALDFSAQNIQQFDSNGTYLRTFGGPGEGPGQFKRVGGELRLGRGDSIVVPDLGNLRVNIFSPDGLFARSFPMPSFPATPFVWWALPDGRLAAQVNVMVMPGQTVDNRANVIVRISPDGTVLDTILALPLDPIFDISRGPASVKTRFFNSTATWTMSGTGLLAVGMTGEYRLSVYTADGTLRMVFAKQHTPIPVSQSDRDAVTEAHTKAMTDQIAKIDNEQVRGMMKDMAGNIEFGETYPAFGGVIAGPEGSWLVRQAFRAENLARAMSRSEVDGEPPAPPAIDVFDADGRFLGTIRFPAGFRLAAVAGGKLYGIETDSLDIPSVVRLTRAGK